MIERIWCPRSFYKKTDIKLVKMILFSSPKCSLNNIFKDSFNITLYKWPPATYFIFKAKKRSNSNVSYLATYWKYSNETVISKSIKNKMFQQTIFSSFIQFRGDTLVKSLLKLIEIYNSVINEKLKLIFDKNHGRKLHYMIPLQFL